MSLLSTLFHAELPLARKGIFNVPEDWVGIWEEWAGRGPAVLLESAGQMNEAGRWLFLAGHPEKEFFERDGKAWLTDGLNTSQAPCDVWEFLEEAGKNKAIFSSMPHCLASAWFGLFSYEFEKLAISRKAPSARTKSEPVPGYYFFKPQSLLAFDRITREWYFFGKETFKPGGSRPVSTQSFQVDSIQPQSNLDQYETMVRKAQNYIAEGDIYQANIAQSFRAEWKGNPGSLYRTLRELNPGPFMGIFQGRDFTVVSSSPERLVTCQGDWLETRPIAGTRPRGKDDIQDLQLQWELKTNPKEQAEHLMLVDLARNDLGRVSRFGTVEMKKFAAVESYARVHHLVSTLEGRRKTGSGVGEILRSFFPGGTITGCPKIRCTEIIDELEKKPRGYYTGSMGFVAPGPCFDFNILIRTFTLFKNGKMEFCAGAGIVADSKPQKEYMETLYKVEALAQALGTSFLSKS